MSNLEHNANVNELSKEFDNSIDSWNQEPKDIYSQILRNNEIYYR